jgi:D-3-phosphoglycerate dehydrogenase / 2-oxoglutarate reductase
MVSLAAPPAGALLVAPHQFPDLDREHALAAEFGLELVRARDQAEFGAAAATAAVVMVTPYARLERAHFASMRHCSGVVRYGIGYDNIDVAAAAEHGVPVSIVPDASSEEVASHAFALGLALSRRIPQGQAAIARGEWAGSVPFDGPVLSDLRVGVIGMGRIGRRVATWWRDVGAQVLAHDPIAAFDEVPAATVEQILAGSDVVSLHVPLLDQTRHMISAETIARMPRGAVLVNVSRGGLVDEVALAAALTSGHLAGAGIDVFEQEPLPHDHPLRSAPNAVLTPHSAWKSSSSLAALQSGAVERARLLLQGEPVPDRVA